MAEELTTVADALVRRWSRQRTLELESSELALVRAYLRDSGVTVRDLPDGRFEVESAGVRSTCEATQLLLLGLRQLIASRRRPAR